MSDLIHLTQEQRIQAREKAKDYIAMLYGKPPTREQFTADIQSKIPPKARNIMVFLCVVVLACAFLLSAMRLYDIGKTTFEAGIQDDTSAKVAGACIVILSEASAVLFTIAASILAKDKLGQRLFIGLAITSAALAISGNVVVAQILSHPENVFAILEAIMPPLFTLGGSFAIKEIVLDDIVTRHAAEREYTEAVRRHRLSVGNPEQHPQWLNYYAMAIKESLIERNKRVRKDLLKTMNQEDWKTEIRRELEEESLNIEVISSGEPRNGLNQPSAIPETTQNDVPDKGGSDFSKILISLNGLKPSQKAVEFLRHVPEARNWNGEQLAKTIEVSAATAYNILKAVRDGNIKLEEVAIDNHNDEAGTHTDNS